MVPAALPPSAPIPRRVDFNTLLRFGNVLVALLTVFVYSQVGASIYADGESAVLALLMAVQLEVALRIERRRRDPFVTLLSFILILYYSLRVATLLLFPFSDALARFPYGAADTNRALVFILLANTLIFAGLLVTGVRARWTIDTTAWSPRTPHRALVLVVFAICFAYGRAVLWGGGEPPRIVSILSGFIVQSIVIAMGLAYLVVFRAKMSRPTKLALFALLVTEMILRTLSGSRSAPIAILQGLLIALLAFHGAIRIRRRVVVMGAVIAPVFLAMVLVSAIVSTYIRAFGVNESFSISRAIELGQNAGERLTLDYAVESGLPLFLSRAGFFDYAAEVIAHADRYRPVVTAGAYARSIVDNLLTPGFDVFDQPKISNSIQFVYNNRGTPSKIASNEGYQSDQIGIYGELFLLFDYASLPLFFFGAVLFKRAYVAVRDVDPFRRTMKRVIILTVFSITINSFGLDWVLMDTVPMVVAVYLYSVFFRSQRLTATAVTERPALAPTGAS